LQLNILLSERLSQKVKSSHSGQHGSFFWGFGMHILWWQTLMCTVTVIIHQGLYRPWKVLACISWMITYYLSWKVSQHMLCGRLTVYSLKCCVTCISWQNPYCFGLAVAST